MIYTFSETIASISDFLSGIIDPRSENLFMGSSPYPTFSLIAWYLIMVKYVLPKYMKNRPAFSLKTVMVYYNLIQVFLNLYVFYESIIASGYGRRFNFFCCRELDQSTTDPHAIAAMRAVHHFYLLKFLEFLDTMFFVLRKKENQISFLHLYHHATMPLNSWIGVRTSPGGSTALGVGLNASIHVVMYTYYLLSGLGQKWQKYLWWKKHMTTIQIIQFIYCILGVFFIYLTRRECPILTARYPLILYFVAYVFSLLILFTQFYLQTYKTKKL